MSISNIMNISKQPLLAHQSAIDTTSNNISNMNTEGYSRRLTNFDQGLGINNVNQNISKETVARVRNQFLEKQYMQQNSYYNKYKMDKTIAQQIEDIFSEPGEAGLSNSLSEFWTAWSDLANDPESQSVRTVVKDKSQALSNTFNRIYNDLNQLQDSLKNDLSGVLNKVNQKLEELNNINKRLNTTQSEDLMDQRDQTLNELSELININTNIGDNGKVSVYSSGQILVTENQSKSLEFNTLQEGDEKTLQVIAGSEDNPLQIKSGEIGSLLTMYNENIPKYQDQLNTLASELAKQVNEIHRSGYNLDNQTGINFFAEGIKTAGDFKLNKAIEDNAALIATSDQENESGNNNIAQSVSNLQNKSIVKGVAPSDFYGSLITEIGSKVQESEYLSSSQNKVVQTLQNQRDSSSGVSLDEEMINLTKYEQGYQAAAKVVNTVNDMMATVLNLV